MARHARPRDRHGPLRHERDCGRRVHEHGLFRAPEGTLSGTISNRSRRQIWTLNQPGDWARYKLDLNGDAAYGGTNELDDTETFNAANEILTRDTDSNASVNYTQVHDAVGNLTDDGKDYEYEYDAFGRLRKVKRTDLPP